MKSKHLLLLLLMAFFAPWAANAQDLADYTFSTGTSETQWITLSDGLTSIVSSGDDTYSSLTDIGFSFPFGDGTYTKFWANANGIFSFSSSPNGNYSNQFNSSNLSANQPKICGITRDMGVSSNGGYVKYELTGTAPNRVLVCEFNLQASSGSSGTPTVNFQVQLHENDSKVVLVYGAAASPSSFQIGLSQSTSDVWTINPSTHEATHATGAVSATYSSWPGQNRYYAFERPVIAYPKPTDVRPGIVTNATAEILWDAPESTNTISGYTFNYKKSNEEFWSSEGSATTTSATIEGLDANTQYDFRVKAWYNNYSGESEYATTNFTTYCNAAPALGYEEDFDDYQVSSAYTAPSARVLPDCWNAINTTTYSSYSVFPTIYYYSSTNYASSTPNSLKFYSTYSSWTNYDPQPQYAILPPMEGLAGMQVALKARGYNATSTFKIGTMSNPMDASTFTMIAEQDGLTTSYQEFEYIVPFTCTDSYLAIMIDAANSSRTYNGVYIDDIVITEAPSCIKPTGLEVTNVTTQTADISWTAGGNETQWQVAIKEGTDDWEIFPTIFDNNSGQLQGLTPATTYQVKVRAYCSDTEQSEWSTEKSFDTPCEAITVTDSWSEDFNSLTAGIPDCWDNSEGTTTNASHKWNYYATGHDGAGLRFNSYSNSSNNTNFLKTPTLNFATGKLMQLTFWYKNPTGGDFSVYISTDGGNTYTTALATGLTGASSWTLKEIDLTNYVDAENVVIVFKGTSNYGSGDAYIYLDDVVVKQAPSCFKPTNLAVTANSITNDGAVITWTAGGSETQWQIEFATNANFTNPLYETVEGEPTYTFHGLDDATTYYVHVQAVCGGSDGSSEYSLPVSFTTLQTAVNLPYANDFENENGWLFVNGNLTNAWAYGEATNNGGTHALYISNDGGTTNAYTGNSAAMVYATKLFNFEAGTYVFSYDWKANGESTWDYLRVALVPSTVQLTASTSAPTVPSGAFYNNLPTGWIALDGGEKLNLKSDWQSFASNEIEVAAGTYMMVFAWRDDTSTGYNPPAAIDNVSIEVVTCTTPTNLAVPAAGITATSVQVSWTETGEATAWQIELTENNNGSSTIDVAETDLVDGVYTIASLTPETMYSVKVRANCGDGFSRWSEEIIFETAEECQMADGLAAANITSSSAVISWNGYGQDYFNLRYGTDGETWTTESKVANPYTLNQLEPATTYYVQVQPTCAGEEYWSATLTFNTKCESITTFPWNEGFEDGEFSICWDQDQIVGASAWSVGSGDYNAGTGSHTGSYNAKIVYVSRGNVTKLITPVLDLTSLTHPQLSFWFINRNWGNDIDEFAVYYRTAPDAAWTLIDATTEAHTTWTAAGYILPNPSATYQIAFEMTDNYGYGVGLDDIVVSEAITKTIAGVGEDNWDEENNGGYYLIASPVVNELNPVAIGMTEGDYDLYSFDEAQNMEEWRNYKDATFKLVNGKGYLYANKNDVTLVIPGEPFGSDVQEKTYTLDYTEGTQFAGWNLVGNPFTQNAYLNKDFYVLNDTRNEVIAAADVEQYTIAPMEGAFVCAEGVNDSVTISYTRSYGNSGSLALNLSQGRGVVDRTVVKFGQGSLPKFQLNPNHTKVYIPQDGKDYAVVSAEAMGEMPVSFKAEKNGTYSLSFTSQEVSFSYLHLIDNMTGADVNLLETPSYTFNASTTDYASRFRLVFATGNSIEGENFGFVNAAGNLCIFGIEGEATVQVVDVMGRVLSSETFSGSYEKSLNAAPGVYMIRLIQGNDMKVQKIVVR